MKISKRLGIAVYSAGVMGIVIVAALVLSYLDMQRIQRTGDMVRQIRSSITELNHEFFSYVLYHEDRPKVQFQQETLNLDRLISGATVTGSTQKGLLDGVKQDSADMSSLFLQLVTTHESSVAAGTPIPTGTEERLVGLLLLKSYEADTSASALRNLVDDGIRVSQIRVIGVILVVVVVATALLAFILTRTRRSIIASLASLSEGAAIIGAGNLEHRIPETGPGELAELSGSFNRMSASLKTVTASKKELENEIEERKRVHKALVLSEQRWATTLTSIGDAVIATDGEGKVTFMNAVAERLTGWTSIQAANRSISHVFNIVNEYTRQSVESPVARVIREGTVVGLANHTILITKDGREVPIDDSGAPIRDGAGDTTGVVLVFRDITERKNAEETLNSAIRRLDAHFANSALAIIEFDPGYHIIRWSEGAHRIFGWAAEEVLGKAIGELRWVVEEDAAAVDRISSEMLGGEHPRTLNVNRNYRKDGTIITCEWHNSALVDGQGRLVSVLSQVLDITERKKADEVKDEFIGMVSHELRTPLTVVAGAVSVMMTEGLPEDDKKALMADVVWGVDAMADIVDNLLELSRWQSSRLVLSQTILDIRQVIEKIVAQSSKKSTTHVIVAEVPPDLPAVSADRTRIERILDNLVDNAIKYSPEGGEVKVSAKSQGERLLVAVSDRGVGISENDISRLFQPFARLGNPLAASSIQGIGLGLVVCRHLVEAHGGTIWVESELGRGSTFFFTVPVHRPTGEAQAS